MKLEQVTIFLALSFLVASTLVTAMRWLQSALFTPYADTSLFYAGILLLTLAIVFYWNHE